MFSNQMSKNESIVLGKSVLLTDPFESKENFNSILQVNQRLLNIFKSLGLGETANPANIQSAFDCNRILLEHIRKCTKQRQS